MAKKLPHPCWKKTTKIILFFAGFANFGTALAAYLEAKQDPANTCENIVTGMPLPGVYSAAS